MTSKNSLDQIEQTLRAEIIKKARQSSVNNYGLVFVLGSITGPFAFIGSMFLPLIGLVLTLLLMLLTGIYLWTQRSFALAFTWLFGASFSVISLTLLFSAIFARMTIVFYVLVAASAATLIVLNIVMSALIWLYYERGAILVERAQRGLPQRPKVLCISTMFPCAALPNFGIFVLRRLKAASAHVDITIVNPIPFFPGATLFARYRYRKKIPKVETIEGLQVQHPRYLSIPGLAKPLDAIFLALRLLPFLDTKYDAIDAQLAFPDGCAATVLGINTNLPVTVTLRGHDINVLPKLPIRGRMIKWTLKHAQRIMAVAQALTDEASQLAKISHKCETIPNGVDPHIFFPVPHTEAITTLQLSSEKQYLLSVGHLIERKGHHLLVEALAELRSRGYDSLELIIVGAASIEGDYTAELSATIAELQMTDWVHLIGEQSQDQLRLWYSASSLLCLASSLEGWANVLLESLACGTPVVATNVWGTPEVIGPEQGVLVERTAEDLARGIKTALEQSWNAAELQRYAHNFSWENAGQKLARNYQLAIQESVGEV